MAGGLRLALPLGEASPRGFPTVDADAFESDVWPLDREPYSSWVADRACRGEWSFLAFGDSPIKGEMKRYLVDKVNIKATSTAGKYSRAIGDIGAFVSAELEGVGSLVELSEREVVSRFEGYMLRRGESVTRRRAGSSGEEPKDSLRMLRALVVHAVLASPEPDILKLDTWPTGDLSPRIVPHPSPKSRRPAVISFRGVPQNAVACDLRRYALHVLRSSAASTACDVVARLAMFFGFVDGEFPEIKETSQVTREAVVAFMGWVNSGGYAASSGNMVLSSLRAFLERGRLLGISVPTRPVVYARDRFKTGKKTPEFFSAAEQRRLLEHLSDLEEPFRWMLTVHYNVGMRVSDLCLLASDCLKLTPNGNWYLDYYQRKTKKMNSVPAVPIVKETIEAALGRSKELYGGSCPYVFAAGPDEPVSVAKYGGALSRYVKRNRILADDGTLLNVRSHKFRATVVTNLVNNPGVGDMQLVRMFMGHARLGALERYAVTHGKTMVELLAPITERDERYIQALGRDTVAAQASPELGLPLCNGTCGRPPESGVCKSCNACYSCAMFYPSKDSLVLFEHQLREVESRIAVAEANGYQRILEMNASLKRQLETIIAKIKQ